MTKHQWHKEIKAWADGKEIEQRHEKYTLGKWEEFNGLWGDFVGGWEFRIKPQPKEPQYAHAWLDKEDGSISLEYECEVYGVMEDDFYKYIGRIELEVDDD